jgi:glutathione S-transferase
VHRIAAVEARLFVIPASHPSIAAALMLDRKGIAFKRTDLVPVISRLVVRALGFPGKTVPALKIDGHKVQGSRQIARELERLRPEPPLFPADPELRAEVEEAERFGDERLQHSLRQLAWWALNKNGAPLGSYSEGARLGIPTGLAVKTAAPIIALDARIQNANDETARNAVSAMPEMLDKVDAWIEAGVLNGEQPNVADFQIAPSIGLAMTFDDLRPAIEGRPAAALAKRFVPDFPGQMPPIVPAEWLAALRAPA